jgi:hypothetical protein
MIEGSGFGIVDLLRTTGNGSHFQSSSQRLLPLDFAVASISVQHVAFDTFAAEIFFSLFFLDFVLVMFFEEGEVIVEFLWHHLEFMKGRYGRVQFDFNHLKLSLGHLLLHFVLRRVDQQEVLEEGAVHDQLPALSAEDVDSPGGDFRVNGHLDCLLQSIRDPDVS